MTPHCFEFKFILSFVSVWFWGFSVLVNNLQLLYLFTNVQVYTHKPLSLHSDTCLNLYIYIYDD